MLKKAKLKNPNLIEEHQTLESDKYICLPYLNEGRTENCIVCKKFCVAYFSKHLSNSTTHMSFRLQQVLCKVQQKKNSYERHNILLYIPQSKNKFSKECTKKYQH